MNFKESDVNFAKETLKLIDGKYKAVRERSKYKLPYSAKDGIFDDKSEADPCWWTNGFWGALMLKLYGVTGDSGYLDAFKISEKALDKAFCAFDGLHHDVGFMWHISSGAHYAITGDNDSRKRALYAANLLAGRFNLAGGFIRAWNGEDNRGWAIIDCMMNIPLLYWASREVGDPRYAMIAKSHADNTIKNHIRGDGSVRHIVIYDPDRGGYVDDLGGQGYAKGSAWSRGQAWAVYGFTLSYIHTKENRYLDAAKAVSDYFIAHLGEDYLVPSDFAAPKDPFISDSSAAAIAACGMIELSRYSGEKYFGAAARLLRACRGNYCDFSPENDALMSGGSAAYHEKKSHDMNLIYGDYFFIEAIAKLAGDERLFW